MIGKKMNPRHCECLGFGEYKPGEGICGLVVIIACEAGRMKEGPKMFKVISYPKSKKGPFQKFHTLELALEACEVELKKGRYVELCDMETSRLMSSEALHPYVGAIRRANRG